MAPILVLGAGIGGLSAAIHLAARGEAVTVLEQNPTVGGKMSEARAAGFRWDTGPSVITMRPVFEQLFRAANRRMEDYLTLLPVEPLTRYFWPDGRQLNLSRDWPETAAQLAEFGPGEVSGYLNFLAEAARLHRITAPVFTFGPPPSLGSLRRVSAREAVSVDPLHTLQWSIERQVRSPHLRQLLGRFATYVGASPYLAPATLAVVAHVELTEGVWYPQGGIYAIANAYERLARELGVEIRCNSRVREICVRDGQVCGVRLETGEILPASRLISNLDVTATWGLVRGELARRQRERLLRRAVSCSGQILLLGVQGSFPELAHHNIFFSENYRREFDQIFREHRLPDDPTLYVCITSKTDPQHAPPGCENWFVMANAPALPPGSENSGPVGFDPLEVQQRLIDRLSARGLNLRGRILHQQLLSPLQIQQRSGAHRGALYGVSFNDRLAPFKRPHNRSPLKGLYFAGGTTHPGGGVPLVTLSGKLAAELCLEGMM